MGWPASVPHRTLVENSLTVNAPILTHLMRDGQTAQRKERTNEGQKL